MSSEEKKAMQRREFMRKAAVGGAVLAGMEVPRWAMPTDSRAFGTGGGIDVEEGIGILEQGKEKNVAP